MKVQSNVLLYVSKDKSYQPGETFETRGIYSDAELKQLLAARVITPVLDVPAAEEGTQGEAAEGNGATPSVTRKVRK